MGFTSRHVILKAVSSQICSAIERVNSGAPTCMATTHLIAVGTQGGFVLVFDSCQVGLSLFSSNLVEGDQVVPGWT